MPIGQYLCGMPPAAEGEGGRTFLIHGEITLRQE